MNKNGVMMRKLFGFVYVLLFYTILYSQPAENYPVIEQRSNLSFTETVDKIKASAEAKGWRVPAVLDLQKSLAMNGQEVRPVNIIEICNPEYAASILNNKSQRALAAYMPCRISVYENEDGHVYVSRMDISVFNNVSGVNLPDALTRAFDDMELILTDVVAMTD
jgi:uncharacterized protein (DUF302 family)